MKLRGRRLRGQLRKLVKLWKRELAAGKVSIVRASPGPSDDWRVLRHTA